MIPIFSNASLEMQDGENHEPAEFLEFIDELIQSRRVRKQDPVMELLEAIQEKEETEFLTYDELKDVNDFILKNYGDRPKDEYGEMVPWNEFLHDY
jgi:hypothetical protein